MELIVSKFQISRRLCFVFLFIHFICYDVNAQVTLTWDDLAEVSFYTKYHEETEDYYLYPKFEDNILSFQNELVKIKGYLINLDLEYSVIILSKNPYASCFFCGMAGPETIIEIELKEPLNHIKLDQKAIIQGKLILNESDFDHFNYILKNAKIEFVD